MKNRFFAMIRWVIWIPLLSAGWLQAQWLTQTNQLKAGWNAVYLHVDASYAPISDVMASTPDIEEIWLWNPPVVGQQFIESPQVPTATGSRWTKWTSSLGSSSPLQKLIPNSAYYVKVKDSVSSLAWKLKGKPAPPSYAWTSVGLNFIGFPMAQQLSYERLFLAAPQLMQGTDLYISQGGAFGSSNPLKVFDLSRTVIRRGEAVWMRVDAGFNRYFGPFEISIANLRGVDFGTDLTQFSFRIRNVAPTTNVIRMTLHRSELPPTGQALIPSLPPLVVRGPLNGATAKYTSLSLEDYDASVNSSVGTGTVEWTLPPAGQPGADQEVVVGVKRSQITEEAGTVLAGILRLKDADGYLQVDLPVSATAQSTAGLWVGDARVTQVSQYLNTYATDGSGALRIGRRWTSTSVDTFTGGDVGDGLDLEGTFTYAVNVGEATSATVGNVLFKKSSDVPGYTQTIQYQSATWLQPDYGTTAADNALESVMKSIGYSGNPVKPTFQMTVEQGVRYKLQLLFGESGSVNPWRGFNVLLDGKVIVPNLIPGAYTQRQGPFTTQKNVIGVVLTHEFTASTNSIKVELDGAGATSTDILNRDPILNALTLERLDSSTLAPELVAVEGAYILQSSSQRMVGVPKPFSLRLIVHDDGTNTVLLQRVFVGTGAASNSIVTTKQTLLAAANLAAARRISAAHLPWTAANTPWTFTKDGFTSVATVNTPYDAVGSNPFLHQYHPDHDNLNAAFSAVLPKGNESYGITRTMRMTPAAVGDDFEAQTAGFKTRIGSYEETVVLEGAGLNSRTFKSAGTYGLTRISPITRLTQN